VIDADPGLSRCFTPIEVCELSAEEALLAIEGIAPLFEKHHGCAYDENALAKAITWSVRYLPSKALPDKAVQILDLAGARARRRGGRHVECEHVAEVVSELAGVPEERLLESDAERLLRLEELLGNRIVGHANALERISHVLRRNASGFRSRRPIGTFLLLGPTGVGKTETAKAIAECLFHSADAMTRLDLSEYAESHAISRLVGAPPGYVGHDAGGQLTESVRRRPYQVILLDEIEKAHRDVLESFLGVFDEGRLTDGRGRTVDFTNTVILLTSNNGADLSPTTTSRARIGFGPAAGARSRSDLRDREIATYQNAVTDAARRALPPELFNRLDEVLAFAPLSREDVAEVARRILKGLAVELERARGVKLDASDAAVDALLDAGGFDPEMGARPMRRAIGRHIEAPIAEMILKGLLSRGDVATVDVEAGRIVVDAVRPPAKQA
jgi:ATP-dependent Clp protease ATP-binding subunit ClpC